MSSATGRDQKKDLMPTEEGKLDLPLVVSDNGFSPGSSLVPFRGGSILTGEERAIIYESGKQMIASSAMKRKTQHGMADTAELVVAAGSTFAETLDELEKIKKRTRNKAYRAEVEQFLGFMKNQAAKQLAGDETIGATAIAEIINSSPYPPSEVEKPRGFLARLLGL